MNWHRPFALLALSGMTIAAGVAGVNTVERDVAFTRARQVVQEARQQLADSSDQSSIFRRVAQALEPSVVNIRVQKTVKISRHDLPLDDPELKQFFDHLKDKNKDKDSDAAKDDQDDGSIVIQQLGTGSGVILDAENGSGYILTNNHVVGDADRVEVTLADGRIIKKARVVGADPKTDLAVVEIKSDRLIPAQWGDSNVLAVGDDVMAFGSPFGYVGSMTHGIISALHRQAGILGEYGYEDFIQTDAPINPGNSGGPLVDVHGKVIGINTAIASESGGFQGIGFSVPATSARQVYTVLKEKGKITRGWLGIQTLDVAKAEDEAKAAGYTGQTGALIKGVLRNTPASGKLQPGDVIVAMDGKPVTDVQSLRNQIAVTPPGKQVTMRIVRDGKQQDVQLALGEQPTESKNEVRVKQVDKPGHVGLSLKDVPNDEASALNIPKDRGALVAKVEPGSPAADAGLHKGDVILRVGQQDVHNAQDAAKALRQANLDKGVRLLVANREGTQQVFLQSAGG